MIYSLFITFGMLLIGVAVPILEINGTHVFNPDWTPHVRIHEVWQLTTNCLIAGFSLYLVWIKKNTWLPAWLGLFVTGGFLWAFTIRGYYGGSMQYLDGSEKTIAGINIGIIGFGIATALFAYCLAGERLDHRETKP